MRRGRHLLHDVLGFRDILGEMAMACCSVDICLPFGSSIQLIEPALPARRTCT
jgi:hypothetical protein